MNYRAGREMPRSVWCHAPRSRSETRQMPTVADRRTHGHGCKSYGSRSSMVTRDTAAVVRDAVVDAIDPLEIILFGSIAREASGRDIDLLVVTDEDGGSTVRDRRAALRSALRPLRHRYDIDDYVVTRSDLAEYVRQGSPFVRKIMSDGVCIYMREATKGVAPAGRGGTRHRCLPPRRRVPSRRLLPRSAVRRDFDQDHAVGGGLGARKYPQHTPARGAGGRPRRAALSDTGRHRLPRCDLPRPIPCGIEVS